MSKYPKEYKMEAIELSNREDLTCKEVAEDLGISVNLLYNWRSQARKEGEDAFPGKGNQTPGEARINELERENEKLKNERDILKKAMSIFAD